ncbi:MAG: hypothetical protein GXP49_03400 [Deltaproteobacteria bacterium]|nr:hypothetical protein [Deltaproteobacteria bacterium]
MRVSDLLVSMTTAICFLGLPDSAHGEAPSVMVYQGFLSSAGGQAITDVVSITFRLYDSKVGGNMLWEETHDNVNVESGLFTLVIGTKVPLDPALFSAPDRFLGVAVNNGTEMTPRQEIGSVPYSLQCIQAEDARTLAGHGPDYFARASDIKPADITVGLDFNQNTNSVRLSTKAQDITSVTISAPTSGWIQVTITGQFIAYHDSNNCDTFTCQAAVSLTSGKYDGSHGITWVTQSCSTDKNAFSTMAMFQVDQGDTTIYYTALATNSWASYCNLNNAIISALFVPHKY